MLRPLVQQKEKESVRKKRKQVEMKQIIKALHSRSSKNRDRILIKTTKRPWHDSVKVLKL